MRAMILAAGLGTRMRPLTEHTPKPMVMLAGKPLIDWSIDALIAAGIDEIVVNVSYLGEQVEAHLHSRSDANFHISHEQTPLETGGGIKRALALLGDAPFLVMNSDAFCLDGCGAIQQLQRACQKSTKPMQLLLQPVEQTVGYDGNGDFFCDDLGAIQRKKKSDAKAPYVFTGMQIIHPTAFDGVDEEIFSMNLLYDREKTDAAVLPNLDGVVHKGTWLHVGSVTEKEQAEGFLAARKRA